MGDVAVVDVIVEHLNCSLACLFSCVFSRAVSVFKLSAVFVSLCPLPTAVLICNLIQYTCIVDYCAEFPKFNNSLSLLFHVYECSGTAHTTRNDTNGS